MSHTENERKGKKIVYLSLPINYKAKRLSQLDIKDAAYRANYNRYKTRDFENEAFYFAPAFVLLKLFKLEDESERIAFDWVLRASLLMADKVEFWPLEKQYNENDLETVLMSKKPSNLDAKTMAEHGYKGEVCFLCLLPDFETFSIERLKEIEGCLEKSIKKVKELIPRVGAEKLYIMGTNIETCELCLKIIRYIQRNIKSFLAFTPGVMTQEILDLD